MAPDALSHRRYIGLLAHAGRGAVAEGPQSGRVEAEREDGTETPSQAARGATPLPTTGKAPVALLLAAAAQRHVYDMYTI